MVEFAVAEVTVAEVTVAEDIVVEIAAVEDSEDAVAEVADSLEGADDAKYPSISKVCGSPVLSEEITSLSKHDAVVKA